MRSIPEKTLEHWASMYVTYRYRSLAGLWWPATGEDAAVGSLPAWTDGKTFKLEIKTAEALAHGRHSLEIRVRQLRDYLRSPVPTYYVVPLPPWHGVITQAAAAPWRSRLPPHLDKTDLGYTRADHGWFGGWVYVIPDYALYQPIAAKYPTTGYIPYPLSETLLTFDAPAPARRPSVAMGPSYATLAAPGLPGSPFLRWRDFWERMDECGGPALPSVLSLSSPVVLRDYPSGSTVQRQFLVDRLKPGLEAFPMEQLALFAPVDRLRDGPQTLEYRRLATAEPEVWIGENEEPDVGESHLVTAFISARGSVGARRRAEA